MKTVRPKATGVRIPLPAPTKTLTEPSVKVFCLLAQKEGANPPLYCVAMQMGCASRAEVIGELAHQGLAQTHFACKMYPSISYFHICCKTFFGDRRILQDINRNYALIVSQNSRGEIPLPFLVQGMKGLCFAFIDISSSLCYN